MPDLSNPDKPNAPVWLKVLVAFHVIAITAWALPNRDWTKRAPSGTDWLLYYNQYNKQFPPIQAYVLTTGFWQYWDMFSPNPAQIDTWVDAEVTYKNGEKRWYLYPRMYLLPINEKFLRERYRKFYERVNEEKNSYYWPVFAQRIAHLNDDPKNPPVGVKLRRHWLQVFAPGKPQQKDYNTFIYYDHVVDQKKLAEDRKGVW